VIYNEQGSGHMHACMHAWLLSHVYVPVCTIIIHTAGNIMDRGKYNDIKSPLTGSGESGE
jgi:hypothetical protein